MKHENDIKLIAKQLRKKIENKYHIIDMKLFGSSARGDFSSTSDIDIMVKLPVVNRKIEEDLFNMAYDLELKYDCIIDIIVLSKDIKYNIPLYQNIEREGVAVWIKMKKST